MGRAQLQSQLDWCLVWSSPFVSNVWSIRSGAPSSTRVARVARVHAASKGWVPQSYSANRPQHQRQLGLSLNLLLASFLPCPSPEHLLLSSLLRTFYSFPPLTTILTTVDQQGSYFFEFLQARPVVYRSPRGHRCQIDLVFQIRSPNTIGISALGQHPILSIPPLPRRTCSIEF